MSTGQAIMECMEEHHADAQEAATRALMHEMRRSPGMITHKQIEALLRQAFIDGAIAERSNPLPAPR